MQRFQQMDGICIGDNEPYSGRHPNDFTIDYHAESDGLPHVGIEVRQDLVKDTEGARKWAGILAAGLGEILADDGLYRTLESGQ
jgi:predicted N-formylglutamate amidohydrolase